MGDIVYAIQAELNWTALSFGFSLTYLLIASMEVATLVMSELGFRSEKSFSSVLTLPSRRFNSSFAVPMLDELFTLASELGVYSLCDIAPMAFIRLRAPVVLGESRCQWEGPWTRRYTHTFIRHRFRGRSMQSSCDQLAADVARTSAEWEPWRFPLSDIVRERNLLLHP